MSTLSSDDKQADIPAYSLLKDVDREDMCMVISLENSCEDSNRGSSNPIESDPRPLPHRAHSSMTGSLLICYKQRCITSSVPMSPAQELRHQGFNEDLAVLHARFRSYKIMARPLQEQETSCINRLPRSMGTENEVPLQMIGFCDSPLQGVQFLPETLHALGVCDMQDDEGVWHESPNEWRNVVITPSGQEVMHLIWAGCVALSGLGKI